MLHRLVYCFPGVALLLLCACHGYDFKVNDKIVYAPNPLFSDFTVSDPGLNNCLKQAINDGDITAPEQLTTLDCSFAGIENLDGLSTFTALTTLRLSANKIRNLVEISNIASLQELFLDDNQIIDPVPLNQLAALRKLDLSGNPSLQCPKPGSLAHVATVVLPQHCR